VKLSSSFKSRDAVQAGPPEGKKKKRLDIVTTAAVARRNSRPTAPPPFLQRLSVGKPRG